MYIEIETIENENRLETNIPEIINNRNRAKEKKKLNNEIIKSK